MKKNFDVLIHVTFSLGEMQIRTESIPEGAAERKDFEEAIEMLYKQITEYSGKKFIIQKDI